MKTRLWLILVLMVTVSAWAATWNITTLNVETLSVGAANTNCVAPSISASPVSVACVTNTTTNFTVTASGTAPLSYQWRTNGVDVSDVAGYSGTTTATLWVSNVVIAQSNWSFACLVSNACGSVTSSVATLTVTNGAASSYLISEDFEDASTGFNTNNWTASYSPPYVDPKYATSPAPLAGTQSLTAYSGEGAYCEFTATREIWVYFVINVSGITAGQTLCSIRNGTDLEATLEFNSDGTLKAQTYNGTTVGDSASTAAAMSANATVCVWGHYQNNSGVNSVLDVEWQDTSTGRSGSGTHYAQVTTGNSTLDATRAYFRGETSYHQIWDTVRISASAYFTP